METITAGTRRTPPLVPRADSEEDRDTRPPLVRRPPVPRAAVRGADPEQAFVTALRTSAPRFAAAASAVTAVVAEAVPPARHRRARCRVVLLATDGTESAVTFLGAAGAPTASAAGAFTAGMIGWLRAGGDLSGGWAVPDAGAGSGVAVDVVAWRPTR